MRLIRRLFLLLVVLVVVVGAWVYHRVTTPYRGFTAEEIFIDLPMGTREAQIARRLADAGVVPDPWTFRLAVRMAHAERRLRAGEYRFAAPASPVQVAERVARGDVFTFGVTFPEGLTIHEMAPIFQRSGLGAAGEFERAASDGTLAARVDPGARTLEGYLFPSTYAMPRHVGAAGTVHAMLAQFEHVFDAKLREAAAARQMTVRQAVTLASLIEKESAQPEERATISAVFQNRLAAHMPLQCDPTVIYALMQAGKWNGDLTKQDLQLESPYNTYRYPGLPPGPIASPGRASLQAAVHPADVPYLYFVSRNDGTHVFAATLDEHNRNVAKWQKKH